MSEWRKTAWGDYVQLRRFECNGVIVPTLLVQDLDSEPHDMPLAAIHTDGDVVWLA